MRRPEDTDSGNTLEVPISLNMALPCRISVWVENGKTKIGMLSPKSEMTATKYKKG